MPAGADLGGYQMPGALPNPSTSQNPQRKKYNFNGRYNLLASSLYPPLKPILPELYSTIVHGSGAVALKALYNRLQSLMLNVWKMRDMLKYSKEQTLYK